MAASCMAQNLEVLNIMNKTTLIARMAEKSELTKKQAEAALNAFTETILEALKEGDKVQLTGFGTFDVKERAARVGRKPIHGGDHRDPRKEAPDLQGGQGIEGRILRVDSRAGLLPRRLPCLFHKKCVYIRREEEFP